MADFTIKNIFQHHYSIPIYQRAYAWTEKEINTLIDDIYDYYRRNDTYNYYIGSLVVHSSSEEVLSVIDGQQRLTTLSLLICYLKNESNYSGLVEEVNVSLNFESRKRSTNIFRMLKNRSRFHEILDIENELIDGYLIIRKKLLEKDIRTSSPKYDEGYFKYLLNNVILIKNELPKETDLNHYFEVMNNRGEQLEKHEIVKAYLMGILPQECTKERSVISEIWNACQEMDKYVQLGFKSDIRDKLFSEDWDRLSPSDFNEVISAFSVTDKQSVTKLVSLNDILNKVPEPEKDDLTDGTGRYHSIINFSNFILQILKLYIDKEPFDWNNESNGISLDDKRLVEQFKEHIQKEEDVYQFMYLLLKSRFLFDNYVIKTDSLNDNSSDDSNWSLHKPYMLKSGSKNNKKLSPRNTFYDDPVLQDIVIKIESMFQVTDPRLIYKNFLFGLLQILNNDTVINNKKFFVNNLISFATQRFIAISKDESVFNSGVDTPNYIFNFLDFVLWYQEKHLIQRGIKASDFEFKYRNSVEHFYPQNPNEREGHKKLPLEILNNFGNLCIMSRSQNSLRSNLMPDAKIKEFKPTDQSLKFEMMQKIAEKDGIWSSEQIMKHGQEMRNILEEFVDNLFKEKTIDKI